MAYTINFERDFVGTEELQLLKTKQAIFEKLQLRFGEAAHAKALPIGQTPATKGLPHKRATHRR